jgi:hypothetical protein
LDALLLASFLTGPAFRAMTNGLPSSAAAGAASIAFLGGTLGFNAKENAGFTAGTDVAGAVEAAAGLGSAPGSFVEATPPGAVTDAAVSAGVAVVCEVAAASDEDSGFSLISWGEVKLTLEFEIRCIPEEICRLQQSRERVRQRKAQMPRKPIL